VKNGVYIDRIPNENICNNLKFVLRCLLYFITMFVTSASFPRLITLKPFTDFYEAPYEDGVTLADLISVALRLSTRRPCDT
jgi:hypothetical protein